MEITHRISAQQKQAHEHAIQMLDMVGIPTRARASTVTRTSFRAGCANG
jgi:hypothetical protein